MARSRRYERPNAFVALSDVTISLSFIILIFALTAIMRSGAALLDVDRLDRQGNVRSSLVQELQKGGYPNAHAEPIEDIYEKGVPKRRLQKIFEGSGTNQSLLATVDENAGLQRIKFFRICFRDKTAEFTPEGVRLYRALSRVLSKNHENLEYVYFNGVTNNVPNRSHPSEEWISRARASAVFQRLQAEGAIQTALEARDGSSPGKVDLKNAMWYGTGDNLYVDKTKARDERVDVVLFYTDRGRKE